MKLLGAALLLGAGTLCGCSAAQQLDRRVQRLRLLRSLLLSMISELRSVLPLIPALLRTLAAQPAYADLHFLQAAAADAEQFPVCWRNAVSNDKKLPQDERSILQRVGEILGSCALEGQLAALELCLERITDMQREAEQCAAKKGSLYRSMGVLAGMFAVILIL